MTGGAGYLGIAICETLAELGANVAIVSRDHEKCESWANELSKKYNSKTLAISVDITDPQGIRRALRVVKENFRSIDILVNNAWSGKKNTFESITYDDWKYDIDVCLNAVFYCVKEAFEYLKLSSGVILNTASMYGHVSPDYRLYQSDDLANPPSYGAAKAGVIQLTKYLASFLSPHNIRVNAISPGPFPFPEICDDNPEFIEALKNKTMANRIGSPEDLKGVVALLCTDASKYITGQNICVDGGWAVW